MLQVTGDQEHHRQYSNLTQRERKLLPLAIPNKHIDSDLQACVVYLSKYYCSSGLRRKITYLRYTLALFFSQLQGEGNKTKRCRKRIFGSLYIFLQSCPRPTRLHLPSESLPIIKSVPAATRDATQRDCGSLVRGIYCKQSDDRACYIQIRTLLRSKLLPQPGCAKSLLGVHIFFSQFPS